jgi:indoleamine 2,3-dioxygenase
MEGVPSDHFLNLPRPDPTLEALLAGFDATTLAAHDFDVDNRTGLMPPDPPLARLSGIWEENWEVFLDDAIRQRLQLGDKLGLTLDAAECSESWRGQVRKMPILPIIELKDSEVCLRRAHCVLTFLMHFYVHSLPPDAPVVIPRSISVPLLQVSAQLQLPPIMTYSDTVVYNWALKRPSDETTPELDNLKSSTLFTSTIDEEEFYLASSRIEFRGVEALELMRATMDEAFVGDDIANRRITTYLERMVVIIGELETILLALKTTCDPDRFYNDIRPWFRGADSSYSNPTKNTWKFEGVGEEAFPGLEQPVELSGPSAGQSTLIHALDEFFCVDQTEDHAGGNVSLLHRMRKYMPRHHRAFLSHLASNPRPLRTLVTNSGNTKT